MVAGSPTLAMQHLDQAWALFDRSHDDDCSLIYRADLGASVLIYLCSAACLSGSPLRSHERGQDAASRARVVGHANTHCYVLLHTALWAYLCSDRPTLGHYISQLQPLAEKHGLPVWQAPECRCRA